MNTIQLIESQLQDFPITKIKNGLKLDYSTNKLSNVSFRIKAKKIILPTREGEFIKNIYKLPLGQQYSLSYPGTASTKSMVVFTGDKQGVFIGNVPTYKFAKIKVERGNNKKLLITYSSTEHKLFFLPFKNGWREGARRYQKLIHIEPGKIIRRNPKYMLQIGIRDPEGNCNIEHFEQLKSLIDYFCAEMGKGHIIHFFGTNKKGFDRMTPDIFIDPKLGGKKALSQLVSYIQKRGFLTSHHYTPRFADINWIKLHPRYKSAILRNKGSFVIEHYKERSNYVMNPNNKKWFKLCLKRMKYLKQIGFDYLQLDQVTYQRNFYNAKKEIQLGYRKMINELKRMKTRFWMEGLSDFFKLPAGSFYQILIRDRARFWPDHENRRGYPYGVSYPSFFMFLYPNTEISYQLVTENDNLKYFRRKSNTAKKINATVYDLQMTFYSKKYMKLLQKIIDRIKNHEEKS